METSTSSVSSLVSPSPNVLLQPSPVQLPYVRQRQQQQRLSLVRGLQLWRPNRLQVPAPVILGEPLVALRPRK